MGLCEQIGRNVLNADKILENINKFFQGMIIRQLGIDQITESVKQRVMSGQVADIQGWSNFLNEEIYNSQFAQTSQAFVGVAMNDAQTNYGDQTLPLLSLLFLANSDPNTFLNAFKAVNLARNAQNAGAQVQNAVQSVQAGMQGGLGGMLSGLAQGINAARNVANVAQQAQNPSIIKQNDLKNLCSYFVNFVTLLPVNLLSKYGEGSQMKGYFTTVLNNSFNKTVQDRFVNDTLFAKYQGQETVNVDEFFNENYTNLKDDTGLRKGLVNNYINNLSVNDIRNLIGS